MLYRKNVVFAGFLAIALGAVSSGCVGADGAGDASEGHELELTEVQELRGGRVPVEATDAHIVVGVLRAANSLSFEELDRQVNLDRRAAAGIVRARGAGFVSLAQLDAVPYVGRRAMSQLAAYAADQAWIGFCGDFVVNGGVEGCDDGNVVDGDGCSALCNVEFADAGDGVEGDGFGAGGGAPFIDTPTLHEVREGSYHGIAILTVANRLNLWALDERAGLDTRSAKGIFHTRAAEGDFDTLEQLAAAPFVGLQTFQRLLAYAMREGFVPSCGDGELQPVMEQCDSTPGCSERCTLTYQCGDGVVEVGEDCDDGNLFDEDGCSALCEHEVLGAARDAEDASTATDIGAYRLLGSSYRSANDFDYYRLTLDRTTRVRIDVYDPGTGGDRCRDIVRNRESGTFNPGLSLRNADDREIAELRAGCGYTVEHDHGRYDLDRELAPGTYYIQVRGQDFGWVSDGYMPIYYRMLLILEGSGPVCGDGLVDRDGGEACDDANGAAGDGCNERCEFEVWNETEPNDTLATAERIGTYTRIEGAITDGDSDWYEVRVPEGGELTARVGGTGGFSCRFDSYLDVYDSAGERIAEDDDDAGDYCSLVDPGRDPGVRGLAGGAYYVRVRHLSNVGGGEYTLALTVR